MDEDFALWNFIEAERERYAEQDSGSSAAAAAEEEEEEIDEDELNEDELTEKLAEKIGQGILRRGGNY